MGMIRSDYRDVRNRMRPGDVLAFGGKGNFSQIIKAATKGPVSHVGVVLQTKITHEDAGNRFFNNIIESTSLNGFTGVTVNRVSDRLRDYDGEVWWLPLSRALPFDQQAFFDFMFHHAARRTPYDLPQAILAAVDTFDGIGLTRAREDFGRMFCSELVAAGLEEAGTIGEVNASDVLPIEICRWRIFGDEYHQLAGESVQIPRFNTAKAP